MKSDFRDTAHITGKVARWARERASISPAQLAKQLGRGHTAEQILAWEKEQALSTFAQAENLAEKLKLPFAILFMREPPKIELPLPDLRTVSGAIEQAPSIEFLDVLSDCFARQRWYREYQLEEHSEPLPFVGRFGLGDSIEGVAQDITRTLGINDELRRSADTWLSFLTRLVERAEQNGILVMCSGVVRHASRRGLNVREFRGFAISDDIAPVVFINTRDARVAQTFTLVHELVHVWIAASGISNPSPNKRAAEMHPIERFCNAVAAEVLVPARNISERWDSKKSIAANVSGLSSLHRVSRLVVIIRLRDVGKISWQSAGQLIEEEYARYQQQVEKERDKEGGPSFWTPFVARNSARFTNAVVSAVKSERLGYRDAADLLGVKVGTLNKYSTS